MEFAVFDVDKTLIRKDSLIMSARYANNSLQLLFNFILLIPYAFLSRIGILSTKKFKEKFIKIFNICSLYNDSNRQLNRQSYEIDLIKAIRPEAFERIKYHKSRGERVILCSASPRMILNALAKELKVDLVCTELEIINKKWAPKIIGKNCKGLEKVKRLEKLLSPLEKHDFHAYGDSKGDRELLKKSKWPHYKSFSNELNNYPDYSINEIIPIMAFIIILYAFYIINNHGIEIFPLLKNLRFEIIIGLTIVLFGYFLRYLRWRIFLNVLDLNPPIKIDLIAWMGSYAFTVTPGKAGEGIRSFLLKNRCNLSIPKTLASIFMERLSDGISVLLILIINLFILEELNIKLIRITMILFLLILILFLLARTNSFRKLSNKFINLLPQKIRNGIIISNESFYKFINFNTLVITTLIGTLSWFGEGLSFWIILKALNITNISLAFASIAHLGSGLLGAISFLPGGLGATEVGTLGFLSMHDVPFKLAMTSTILIRLMTLWFATILGITCLLIPFKKVKADNNES